MESIIIEKSRQNFILILGSIVLLTSLTTYYLYLNNIGDYAPYFILGIIGAIFANSTGAGGGVVFIPAFEFLGISPIQGVATSFAIQCFGMTAGALSWLSYYKKEGQSRKLWQPLLPIIGLCALPSIAGLWTVYGFDIAGPGPLYLFSWFSICLGISILLTAYYSRNRVAVQNKVHQYDRLAIIVVGYLGGVITAWLSVGVGELLVVYLILRGFDVTMAVAAAVIVTAFTVWFASLEHFILQPNIYWPIVLFAGPGALVGGMLATRLVSKMSPQMLKVFFAIWILVVGIIG